MKKKEIHSAIYEQRFDKTDIIYHDIMEMKGKIIPDQKDILIFLVDDDLTYLKSLELEFRQNPNLEIETFMTSGACIEKFSLKPDIIIRNRKV